MADGLILLFEDEDGLAELYSDVIQMSGYTVQHYFKPTDFLGEKPEDITRTLDSSKLIWTDGDMPLMHGLDLAQKLRIEHNYTKPIVYNSGRLAQQDIAELETRTVQKPDGSQIILINRALAKPITVKTTLQVIAELTAPKP